MNREDSYFDRAVVRILRLMLLFALGGAIAAGVWRGWTWSAGFAVGAVVSWLNFRWLKQIVDALGNTRTKTRKRVAVVAGLRYLLLGGGAYVILHYSRISLPAALAGLFVAAGAVIVEILFELVYART
jgi:hypothetical protein